MQLPDKFIEQIKDKVRLSSYIGKSIKLEKRGNQFLGLCPFHNEKTPSFSVNDEKGFYHCFGCHAGGDIFKFVMETTHCDFYDSVKMIAEQENIELPKFSNKILQQQEDHREELYKILKIASEFFSDQLIKTNGSKAREYLKSRNINSSIISDYLIGFAPSKNNSLLQFLLSKNFSIDSIIKTGLLTKIESGYIDKFRNRIIFPILDSRGKIIAFGGRVIDSSMPKYLNSPETEVFKKSEVLFGLDKAKNIAAKKNRIIVVEGYLDSIALYKAGIHENVATLGTAITINHLEKLWKIVDEPIICLDGDKAGVNAMHRIALLAFPKLRSGKSLNFVLLPNSMDPDDIIKSYGVDNFNNLLVNSVPLSEIIWNIEHKKLNKNTPEQFAMLEKILDELCDQIGNSSIKKNYKDFFQKKIWMLKRDNKFNNSISKINEKYNPSNIAKMDIVKRFEHILVAQVLDNVHLLKNDEVREEFLSIDFSEDFLDNMRRITLDNLDDILNEDNSQELKYFMKLNNLTREYEFLCGNKSQFIDKISKYDENITLYQWQLQFKKYKLSLIEREYHEKLGNLDQEDKLVNLNQEMAIIRESINKIEQIINK